MLQVLLQLWYSSPIFIQAPARLEALTEAVTQYARIDKPRTYFVYGSLHLTGEKTEKNKS